MSDLDNQQHNNEDEFLRHLCKSQCTLYAYIVGLTNNPGDADDVLQEANVALWKKRQAFNPHHEFLPWAIGFAKLEINKYRKRIGKRRLLFSDDVINLLASDWPEDASYQEQQLAALMLCLKKLPDLESHYISSFYKAGCSVNELAETNNTPASTIYKILTRARGSLRSCIQRTLAQSCHAT